MTMARAGAAGWVAFTFSIAPFNRSSRPRWLWSRNIRGPAPPKSPAALWAEQCLTKRLPFRLGQTGGRTAEVFFGPSIASRVRQKCDVPRGHFTLARRRSPSTARTTSGCTGLFGVSGFGQLVERSFDLAANSGCGRAAKARQAESTASAADGVVSRARFQSPIRPRSRLALSLSARRGRPAADCARRGSGRRRPSSKPRAARSGRPGLRLVAPSGNRLALSWPR